MEKFKLKNKPKKPTKKLEKTKKAELLWFEGRTLSEIIEVVPLEAEVVCNFYYDEMEAYFYWTEEETDEEFEKRVDLYNSKLKKYDEWYKENKDKIEEEVLRRKRDSDKRIQNVKDEKINKLNMLAKELGVKIVEVD